MFNRYTILLSLPLVVTWTFSISVYININKRREKLNFSPKSSLRRSKNENQTSTPTPINSEENNKTPRLKPSSENKKRMSTSKQMENNKTDKTCPDKNFDCSSLKTSKEALNKQIAVKIRKLSKTDCLKPLYACAYGKKFEAKQLMYRNSWGKYPLTSSFESLDRLANAPLRKCLSYPHTPQASSFKKPPTASSPSAGVKNSKKSLKRNLNSSVRFKRSGNFGQSTIRRRFLQRSSAEMGIAKTLFYVVIAVTMTTCPLIATLLMNSSDWGDRETTWLVVAMTMLVSNSWWNSMIYGARMPYFRQMMKRAWCRYFGGVRCCGKMTRSGRKR